MVLGESSLSDVDKLYLAFADRFEKEFVGQGYQCERTIIESLDLGWELLRPFPISELKRINSATIEKYHPDKRK